MAQRSWSRQRPLILRYRGDNPSRRNPSFFTSAFDERFAGLNVGLQAMKFRHLEGVSDDLPEALFHQPSPGERHERMIPQVRAAKAALHDSLTLTTPTSPRGASSQMKNVRPCGAWCFDR